MSVSLMSKFGVRIDYVTSNLREELILIVFFNPEPKIKVKRVRPSFTFNRSYYNRNHRYRDIFICFFKELINNCSVKYISKSRAMCVE